MSISALKIFLPFILFISLFEVNGQEFVNVEKNYANGLTKERYHGVVVGIDTTRKGSYSFYFENGRLMQEGFYTDNRPDSIWITYFPSGARKSLFNYSRGLKSGGYIFWNYDGSIYQKGTNKSDKLDGLLITYFPNGQATAESNYQKGYLNGVSKV
mgnify:CR=1 FL=1